MNKWLVALTLVVIIVMAFAIIVLWQSNTSDANAQSMASLNSMPACPAPSINVDYMDIGTIHEANGVKCEVQDASGTGNTADRRIMIDVTTPYNVGDQINWNFDDPPDPVCADRTGMRMVSGSSWVQGQLGLSITGNNLKGSLKEPSDFSPYETVVENGNSIKRYKAQVAQHSTWRDDDGDATDLDARRDCQYRTRYTIRVQSSEPLPTPAPTATMLPPTPEPSERPAPTPTRATDDCENARYGHDHKYGGYGGSNCLTQAERDRYNLGGSDYNGSQNTHASGSTHKHSWWTVWEPEPHGHD